MAVNMTTSRLKARRLYGTCIRLSTAEILTLHTGDGDGHLQEKGHRDQMQQI